MGQYANPSIERKTFKQTKKELIGNYELLPLSVSQTIKKLLFSNLLMLGFIPIDINIMVLNSSVIIKIIISASRLDAFINKRKKQKRITWRLTKPLNFFKVASVKSLQTKKNWLNRHILSKTLLDLSKLSYTYTQVLKTTPVLNIILSNQLTLFKQSKIQSRKKKARLNKNDQKLNLYKHIFKQCLFFKSPYALLQVIKKVFVRSGRYKKNMWIVQDVLTKLNLKHYGIYGLKLVLWGKLTGADRSKQYKLLIGNTPLQRLSSKSKSAIISILTPTGTFGVKCVFII